MTKRQEQILEAFDCANNTNWQYSLLEAVMKAAGEADGYQDVKAMILSADKKGVCPKAVERYVRTLKDAHGNLPAELASLGEKYNIYEN